MINMLDPTVPLPGVDDLQHLYGLIALVSNPEATKQRLAELDTAAKDASAAVSAASAALADMEKQRSAQTAALKGERDNHDQKLAEDRATFADECVRRSREIDAQAKTTAALQAKAKTDADAAAILKADLTARIEKIKAAVI